MSLLYEAKAAEADRIPIFATTLSESISVGLGL